MIGLPHCFGAAISAATPTALSHLAQGRAEGATLGDRPVIFFQPQRGCGTRQLGTESNRGGRFWHNTFNGGAK